MSNIDDDEDLEYEDAEIIGDDANDDDYPGACLQPYEGKGHLAFQPQPSALRGEDWFGRDATQGYIRQDSKRQRLDWQGGHNHYSDFLFSGRYFGSGENARRKKLSETAKLTRSMMYAMKLRGSKSSVKLHKSADGSTLTVPYGIFHSNPDKAPEQVSDLFLGAFLTNVARHKHIAKKDRAELAAPSTIPSFMTNEKVASHLARVLAEEFAEQKMASDAPGYLGFIGRFKEHRFGEKYQPVADGALPQTRLLDLICRFIRFPGHITDDEVLTFRQEIEYIKDLIQTRGGIPASHDARMEMGRQIATVIMDYRPPGPPPSAGQPKVVVVVEPGQVTPPPDSNEPPEAPDENEGIVTVISQAPPPPDSREAEPENEFEAPAPQQQAQDEPDEQKALPKHEPEEGEEKEAAPEPDQESEPEPDEPKEREPEHESEPEQEEKEAWEPPPFRPMDFDREVDNLAEMMMPLLQQEDLEVDTAHENEAKDFLHKIFPDQDDIDDQTIGSDLVNFKRVKGDKTAYDQIVRQLNLQKGQVIGTMLKRKARDTWFTMKGMRNGRLDTNRLAEAVQGVETIYERMGHTYTEKLSVGVLVDLSSSMSSSGKIDRARQAAVFLSKMLSKVPDVDAFMYGHTYNHNTEIDVYEEPGHRYPHSLGGIRARGCNRDGTAIRAVADRIRKFTKNACILLVISDGAPSGYGYGEDGRAHTRKGVQDVTKMGFNVIQIAIDSVDSSSMFKHWVTMNHIDSLPGDLAAFLKKKLSIMLREITIT